MGLTKYEVKERLGFGAQKRIAQALGLSEGHVSMVLNERRTDRRVAVAVAHRIRAKLVDLPERYYREAPVTTAAA